MLNAFNEIKRIGGGMVLSENPGIVATLPLQIGGGFSAEPVQKLIEQELELKKALAERGYRKAMQFIRCCSCNQPFTVYTHHTDGAVRCYEKRDYCSGNGKDRGKNGEENERVAIVYSDLNVAVRGLFERREGGGRCTRADR